MNELCNNRNKFKNEYICITAKKKLDTNFPFPVTKLSFLKRIIARFYENLQNITKNKYRVFMKTEKRLHLNENDTSKYDKSGKIFEEGNELY